MGWTVFPENRTSPPLTDSNSSTELQLWEYSTLKQRNDALIKTQLEIVTGFNPGLTQQFEIVSVTYCHSQHVLSTHIRTALTVTEWHHAVSVQVLIIASSAPLGNDAPHGWEWKGLQCLAVHPVYRENTFLCAGFPKQRDPQQTNYQHQMRKFVKWRAIFDIHVQAATFRPPFMLRQICFVLSLSLSLTHTHTHIVSKTPSKGGF